MASKQLGKLRQWAGEVISSRDKTQPSNEFLALEQDMEIRNKGVDRLHVASRDYLAYLSSKQLSDALPGEEPMMQSETLGVVMMGHGEDLGDASALGRSLATFGRARCRIATMQNIYAVTFTDTFLAYLERSRTELDEYAASRKKLESRRLAYDAAITKAEKTYKKEKDKKEAEEELAKAKARYEEMAEDVRAKMDEIREGEVEHQRELKAFLRAEMNFVQQYLDVLQEVESEWPDADTYAHLRKATASVASLHHFSRTSTRSTESKDSDSKQAPPIPSRFGSHRSDRSVQSTSSKKGISVLPKPEYEASDESESEVQLSRASSRASRKSTTKPSRSQSRQSKARSRSGSVTTTGTNAAGDIADDTTSIKSSEKQHKKSTSGVTGWVGDAMSNVMSRNKSRNTDVENFAALEDKDGDEQNSSRTRPSRRLSNRSTNGRSGSQTRSGAESARVGKKVMKALFDFSGSSDELSFKAGDEIVVLNEVLDDWWLGEAGGRRGLFPTNYAVLIKTAGSSATPMKFKNASMSSILGFSRGSGKPSSGDDESRRTLFEPSESELSMTEDEHDGATVDEWHPFDNARHASGPPSRIVIPTTDDTRSVAGASHDQPPPGRPRKAPAVEEEATNEEFNKKLSSSLTKLNVQQVPPRSRSPGATSTSIDLSTSSASASPIKRMPPPPPPRRQTNTTSSGPPPLPFRSIAPSRTYSSSAALHTLAPPMSDRRPHSENSSPFESQSELSFDAIATTFAPPRVSCLSCGCDEFVEDPFRGHGLCANCTHAHT